MIDLIKAALTSAFVSFLVTGLGAYYLHAYLDGKRKEAEQRAEERRKQKRKADVLEARRRRALGRVLFWTHHALIKGVESANGDMEKAFAEYDKVEEEQKALEQEILAEYNDKN